MSLNTFIQRTFLAAIIGLGSASVLAGQSAIPMSCSVSDTGAAVINEVKVSGGGSDPIAFVEIKTMQDNVDVAGWQICIDSPTNCITLGNGSGTWDDGINVRADNDSPFGNTTYPANFWLIYPMSANPSEDEIILIDASGDVIDYVHYVQNSQGCSKGLDWSVPNECGVCFIGRDASQKDFARVPDGSGDWGNNGDTPSEGDTNDGTEPPLPNAVGAWWLDENLWTGASGEVLDQSGNNLHLTAYNGIINEDLTPAITGDPGTCRYGDFNGTNQYLQVADNNLLDLETFTIAIWIYPHRLPSSGLMSILSKDENYEFHLNPSGEVFWWWRTSPPSGSTEFASVGANITPFSWNHVAISYRSGEQVIYVNGVPVGSRSFIGTPLLNSDPFQVGQDQFFSGRYFDGFLDEVRVYDRNMIPREIQQIMNETHPCTSTTGCLQTFSDDFSTGDYTGSQGSLPWSINWFEQDDDGSPNSGRVDIFNNMLWMRDRPNSGGQPSLAREVDLTGFTSAVLTFDMAGFLTNLESSDVFVVEASSNGGASYSVLDSYNGNQNRAYSKDISPYISANTRIRFRIAAGYGENNEWMTIDNVVISGYTSCGPDHFVILHDGSGINCYREAISIQVVDASGAVDPTFTGTINLSTSTNNGSWFTVDSSGSSSDPALGTLTDVTANDGAATYTFVASDLGTVTLYLEDTVAESVNIGITDGTIFDDDSEGLLTFRPFGFVVSPITTQVAGRPFTVALTAAGQTPSQPQCGVIEEYTGNRTLDLWATYSAPLPWVTPLQINGSAIGNSEPTATTQTVAFTNGVANLSVQLDDVGQLAFSAKDDFDVGEPTGGTLDEIIGGIAPFIVRPFAYDIQIAGNPNASTATDPVFAIAGSSFNQTVRSVLWQGADDPDNDGTPNVGADLTDNGVTPNIAAVTSAVPNISLSPIPQIVTNAGVLNQTTLGFNAFGVAGSGTEGVATFSQSWNEVGIITISASTANFMNSGQAVTGSKTNVGRFIPNDFSISITDDFLPQCTGFSYSGFANGTATLDKTGQLDNFGFTVTARNLAGNTTVNYQGNFAKLEAGTISLSPYNVDTAAAASGTLNHTLSAVSFTAGVANISEQNIHYQFDNLLAPFNLRLDLDATDSDSVNGTISSASVLQRLGRIQLTTTYGTELQPLEMPVFTEYFNGSDWVVNSLDNCTQFDATMASFVAGSYQGDLSPGDISATLPTAATPSTLTSGTTTPGDGIWFSAPGAGNSGEVDIMLDLSSMGWLVFDWDNDNINDNPTATLGAGNYRNSDRIIYWKER